mmetsp:Transcript_27803/g.32436  ORF Transcript_27803/g.32436 Transcript_27803/m.32436 type:complete len:264 (+) Transcript_27803:131-922(+)
MLTILWFSLQLVIFLQTQSAAFTTTQAKSIRFRSGTKEDEFQIATTMARELMNPLGINSKRFIIAVNSNNDKELIGWGQLRPIGLCYRNPNTFDAGPGSVSIQQIAEDEIWSEFENEEEDDFPNGFASLPWSKEYQEYAKKAEKRRKKGEALVAKMETESNREQNQSWELASVYVKPSYRGQGIGSEIVRKLLAEHDSIGQNISDVYALTLSTTKDWYCSLGFEITNNPPDSMKGEIFAGNLITKAIGAQLICMQGVSKQSTR